jgi:hypothetical protein
MEVPISFVLSKFPYDARKYCSSSNEPNYLGLRYPSIVIMFYVSWF